MKKKYEPTAYDLCLKPLLEALHWRGTRRQLRESLPHYSRLGSMRMLCDVLQHLNFEAVKLDARISDIDMRFLPCVFVSSIGKPSLILSKTDQHVELFDPVRKKRLHISLLGEDKGKTETLNGTVYTFKRIPESEDLEFDHPRWVRKAYLNNRPLLYGAFGISFFLSFFALITPLFIMFVYNFVIKASSISMLSQFSIGIVIALIGFSALSRIRTKQLSIVGAQFDRNIGNRIFERLLYLAPAYTESASVGSQVARLKDFSRLREYVTGQLMTISFDLPFVTIGLVLVAVLGGLLVFIPLVALAIYILMGLFTYREAQRRLAESSKQATKQQGFILEAINKLRVIKYTASLKAWEERYREISADATIANFRNMFLFGINNALSDAVTIGTGMLVLGFGAIQIMDGTLSVGAMLAVMILSWRILTPIKTIFNAYPRVLQMGNSLRQITRLLHITPEPRPTDVAKAKLSDLRGQITFKQVSLRYPDAYQPALVGVDFNVNPGEMVAITGRNGSGKSSILNLLLRTCQQQMGAVLIDNQDVRQFNEIELRSLIAYLPQTAHLFYGTIADNLRFSNPAVSIGMMEEVANQVGILETIRSLPEGFQTRIRDFSDARLPASFLQELCLVRALIKRSPIVLLDEPTTALDEETDRRLLRVLEQLRGEATVLVVTHRPSYMRRMDRVLLLDAGRLILQGGPDAVVPEIIKELV